MHLKVDYILSVHQISDSCIKNVLKNIDFGQFRPQNGPKIGQQAGNNTKENLYQTKYLVKFEVCPT